MTIKNVLQIGLALTLTITLSGCLSFLGSSKSAPQEPTQKAAPVNEEQVKAQINLATSLLKQGDYKTALTELNKAQGMDPKNVDVANFLGLAYYGLKEYNQSVDSYQKALTLNPNRTDVHNNLGLVFLAQKNYDQALNEFNQCLKDLTYQKKHLPLTNLGLTYYEMARYDEALTALTKAVEAAPEYAKAHQLKGKVYLAQSKNKEAAEALTKAAQLDSNDQETARALNEALTKAKK